jgi:hypothetical protein
MTTYDGGQHEQTGRFRWREVQEEGLLVYYVDDSDTEETVRMEDAADLFCGADGEDDALTPGTPMFYDALNQYFQHEQETIEKVYFQGLAKEVIHHGTVM